MYHPKVDQKKKKKFINLNLQLQERINNWEREREQSPFLEENVRQIIKLYKIRWVEKYLKEKCIVLNTKIIKVMLCNLKKSKT